MVERGLVFTLVLLGNAFVFIVVPVKANYSDVT